MWDQGEIARASYRGRAGAVLLLTAVLGLVIAYWVSNVNLTKFVRRANHFD